jgi:hypothetical protein
VAAEGRNAARAVLIGTVLVATFTFFFVFPAHDPAPNHLPIGVAGAARAATLADRKSVV